jgi:pyruvate/2-oxoglutarate dehydrogenase complex dihydrolipoamide acyltransferase (E2) component
VAESTPVVIPHESVNDESVTLIAWCVANGERVQEGQALAEVEGSKAVFTIPAPVAGIVRYTLEVGHEIAVGAPLCTISSEAVAQVVADGARRAAAPRPVPHPSENRDAESKGQQPGSPRFSREAEALLQQHGLDPQRFVGYGLVRASDVLAMLSGNGRSTPAAPGPPAVKPPGPRTADAPIPAAGVPFRSEPLPRSKQAEIRYLASGSHNTLPSLVTVAVPTRGLRAAVAQYAQTAGSTTAIIVFEVARLLRQYPRFNAFYADGAAHLYDAVNIGLAIDGGHGLKVPVIRDADTKGLGQIAGEMQGLLRSYLDNRLRGEELAGGTFTISDLSGEGVLSFHPLITQGQGAILGIGSEQGSGTGSAEGFFTLILAFDHQLAEGRHAAQFLQELARRLQGYEAAMRSQPGAGEPRCERCLSSLSRLRQLDQGQRGAHFLVHTIQPDGTSAYRCSACLQGW